MVQINFAQKTVNVKIVYYGPGMSGKTTNLEVVHQRAPETNRGDLTSISTDGDRTLFFDYMPLDLGTVAGMRTCFQVYTVPGQVYYNSTRKLVLQGVDGVIFVADSSASMLDQNLESLRNLEENLNEYGKSLSTMPHVLQWNKRDLPDAMPVEELERHLNHHRAASFEATANTGQGVFPTLKAMAAAVLKSIMQETGGARAASVAKKAPAASAPAGPVPAFEPEAPTPATPAPMAPLRESAETHAPPLAPAAAAAPEPLDVAQPARLDVAAKPALNVAPRSAPAPAPSPGSMMQTSRSGAPARQAAPRIHKVPTGAPPKRRRPTPPIPVSAPPRKKGPGRTLGFVALAAAAGAAIAWAALTMI